MSAADSRSVPPGVEQAVDRGKRAILRVAMHAWGAGNGQVGAEVLCEPAARAVVDAMLVLGWSPPSDSGEQARAEA